MNKTIKKLIKKGGKVILPLALAGTVYASQGKKGEEQITVLNYPMNKNGELVIEVFPDTVHDTIHDTAYVVDPKIKKQLGSIQGLLKENNVALQGLTNDVNNLNKGLYGVNEGLNNLEKKVDSLGNSLDSIKNIYVKTSKKTEPSIRYGGGVKIGSPSLAIINPFSFDIDLSSDNPNNSNYSLGLNLGGSVWVDKSFINIVVNYMNSKINGSEGNDTLSLKSKKIGSSLEGAIALLSKDGFGIGPHGIVNADYSWINQYLGLESANVNTNDRWLNLDMGAGIYAVYKLKNSKLLVAYDIGKNSKDLQRLIGIESINYKDSELELLSNEGSFKRISTEMDFKGLIILQGQYIERKGTPSWNSNHYKYAVGLSQLLQKIYSISLGLDVGGLGINMKYNWGNNEIITSNGERSKKKIYELRGGINYYFGGDQQ